MPTAHHGGADIIHYLAARDDCFHIDFDVDKYEQLHQQLRDGDHGSANDLAPIQRALDDLVRTAHVFGASVTNKLWATGVDPYHLNDFQHDDKPRAAAVLNAALDLAKVLARNPVSKP